MAKRIRHRLRTLTGVACLLLLAACGGGGGGGAAGRFIVYLVDSDGDGNEELYATDLFGNVQVPLSPPAPTAVTVGTFALSPDKTRVAYLADEATAGVFDLYVVGVDGTGRVKINGTLMAGSVGSSFAWSPSGDRIIYNAKESSVDHTELYLANADGSGRHRISGSVSTPGLNISNGIWSPDGRYVAYRVTNNGAAVGINTHDTTAITPPTAPDSVRVSHGDVGANLAILAWSPDSRRILYWGNTATEPRYQIFLAEAGVTNSGAVISGSLSANTVMGIYGSFSQDGAYVVYEIWDTSTACCDPVALNYHEVAKGGTDSHRIYGVAGDMIINPVWAPGRNVLAFNVDRAGGERQIWTWSPGQSAQARAVAPSATGFVGEFRWSGEGSYLITRSRLDGSSPTQIETLPVPGSGLGTFISRDATGATPVGSEFDYASSPSGDRVAYRGDNALYVAPADRTLGAVRVSDSLPAGYTVSAYGYGWTADGRSLVFLAGSSSAGAALYSAPASGLTPPRRISVPVTGNGQVSEFQM